MVIKIGLQFLLKIKSIGFFYHETGGATFMCIYTINQGDGQDMYVGSLQLIQMELDCWTCSGALDLYCWLSFL